MSRVRLTTNDFIHRAKEIHGDKYDYSKTIYTTIKSKVIIVCPVHGEFKQIAENHLLGKHCLECNRPKITTIDFIERSNMIHNYKYDYSKSEYTTAKNKITVICPIHGEFKQRADHHSNGVGCPKCCMSKGEVKIETYLCDNNIEYVQQYMFDDCKFKRKLPFDFYIPSHNLCIEYDGEQHFNPMRFDKFNDKFEATQTNDMIKNNYCCDNNIQLLRISYTQYNMIDDILRDTLK